MKANTPTRCTMLVRRCAAACLAGIPLVVTTAFGSSTLELELQQSTDLAEWETVPMTPASLTPDGRLRLSAENLESLFFRMRIAPGEPDMVLVERRTLPAVSGLGPSLGAAMEMRMSPHWDFIVSGRYSFSGLRLGDTTAGENYITAPLSAPILQVHAVFYFTSRGRGYSRR